MKIGNEAKRRGEPLFPQTEAQAINPGRSNIVAERFTGHGGLVDVAFTAPCLRYVPYALYHWRSRRLRLCSPKSASPFESRSRQRPLSQWPVDAERPSADRPRS